MEILRQGRSTTGAGRVEESIKKRSGGGAHIKETTTIFHHYTTCKP